LAAERPRFFDPGVDCIAYVRERRFGERDTVLFWHTGGQVGLFA